MSKDWFRLKKYPHIGFPLEIYDRKWVEKYVSDPQKIASHAFFPFIHRNTKTRKFRREISHDGTRSQLRKPSIKEREIYYASHLDSNIFSYYAQIISNAYEKQLHANKINDCVTAYRQVKVDPANNNSRNKSNVDFADEVFNFIRSSKEKELVAITFDIKSFFDHLDHKLLKKYWRKIIPTFTDDHYNVFRNITKFSYVDECQIFKLFKDQILVERKPNLKTPKPVARKIHLKNKRAIAYCKKRDIDLIRQNGLIKTNKYERDSLDPSLLTIRKKGIPQGSPISAILANVYLFEFDQTVNSYVNCLGGIYRRYSDDMIVICDARYKQNVIDQFRSEIRAYNLEIQTNKTQVFDFKFDKKFNRYFCFEYNLKTKRLQNNSVFEYLGFQFDGEFVMLRNSSLAGYYRKMKRSIRRGRFHAIHNRTSTKFQLFKSRLYKRFTYVGANRRRVYMRDPNNKSSFVLSHKYDWGNYLTYANLAARNMNTNKIAGQIKRHWRKFHKLLHNPLT